LILPCKEEQVTRQAQPMINSLTNVDEKTFLKRVEGKND